MRIPRRQFLKYCVGSAAALGLPMNVIGKLGEALAAETSTLPKVIWISAAGCTGCSISLLNLFNDTEPTDITDLLFNTIDLAFHPTLMSAAGDLAVQQLNNTMQGSYILAVEGGIPTAFNGHSCMLWTDAGREVTALEAVQMLAPGATAVLSIGSCASYGGMSASSPNPTGVKSVSEITGVSTVNIPGCPTHPDSIVWVIAHLLAGESISLDERRRPTALYRTEVHKACPRKPYDEVKTFGTENGCLKPLGCKGPETHSDCPSRKWNSGVNWCIGAGAICIGCTERDFPDNFSPFYKIEYDYKLYEKSLPDNPDPTEPPTEPGGGSLVLTKAVWEAERNRINVEGDGTAGQIVTIFNADTGTQLGAVSVDSTGKWQFLQVDPSPIPNRLRIVSGGQTVFSDVANVPAGGDDNFELTKAEWRADRRRFQVEGLGTKGSIVEIFNASSNNKIGKVTVNSVGKWRLVIRRPATVPCTVRAVCNGQSIAKDVKNAPGGCV